MYAVPIKTLLEAGVHFGHRASRWNPRMEPFIFGKRNLIHIIDLKETLRGLIKACTFLQGIAADGKSILFVGTKRQAQSLIEQEAGRVEMPYVAERWLGGILTNFTTIRSRLRRLEQLEAMESDGTFATLKKKEISRILREKTKIFRNLNGIRHMESLPGALIVVDPRKEKTAVAEARKMGIPVIAVLDTDCDPTVVDIAIPGNDDALRSLQVLLAKLTDAIHNGRQAHAQHLAAEEKRKAESEKKKAEARRQKLESQKKKAAEQAELDKILKQAREERERRKAEAAGEEARAEADEKKPEATPADPEVKEVAETKPGPAGPESVDN